MSAIQDERFHGNLIAAVLVLVLSFGSAVAVGQEGGRNLSGMVTDPQHEPLRGAVVEVEDEVTLGVVSYITSRSGAYSFKRLVDRRDYRVWATWRGHRSATKTVSAFDTNHEKTINFVIEPN